MPYIAEDLPAHMVEQETVEFSTTTDLWSTLYAPRTHGQFDDMEEALFAVAYRLDMMAKSYLVVTQGRPSMYKAAARAVRLGVVALRVGDRYYRVREV